MTRNRIIRVALVAVVQLALVGVAVYPQLSARLTGEEYRLAVGAFDPIDPSRGAYVDLSYPALRRHNVDEGKDGDVYVVLVRDGDLWTSQEAVRTRPDEGPYLACHDSGWSIDCGIESWYLPQDDAAELSRKLVRRSAVATIRVDSRGHAAIVDLELER